MAKRLFDVVASAVGLVLLAPVFAAVGLAIFLDDRGPVFFRQERVGRGGRPFRMWKFRTMRTDAHAIGPQLTIGRDPRITRAGRWLRRTKLDELPQLLNVMGGEMSLVGPRPEVARYVALYTPEQRAVLDLTPGITDPASVFYRDESALLGEAEDAESYYVGSIMPEKIRLNLAYALRASVVTDILVILQTLGLKPAAKAGGGPR